MDDFNEALGVGLRLLHARDRFQEEIRSALAAKDFEADVIEAVLERLQQKGMLSEARAVQGKLRTLSGKRAKGDEALSAELERVGASSEAVAAALEASGSEFDRAKELVKAKFRSDAPPAKVARFLNSRGFREETITSVLEGLGLDPLG